MKIIKNQDSSSERTAQKKQWITPKIEIIDTDTITVGVHAGGTEAVFAPGAPASSPARYNYLS